MGIKKLNKFLSNKDDGDLINKYNNFYYTVQLYLIYEINKD